MHSPILALLVPFAMFAFQDPAVKPAAFDYSKVDRKIVSQPTYVSTPRFALLLVGTEGKTRIWMATDKSKTDLDRHNVLYFDRDADGNLDEEGERFTAVAAEHEGWVFKIGRLEVSDPKVVLEEV